MNKKGFTLIELIAVIVILSLVALVVFPAVTSTIKSSRQSTCKSEIKTIEKAAKQYYLDNISELPDEIDDSTKDLNIYNLVIEGYLDNEELVNIFDDSIDMTAEEKNGFKTRNYPGITNNEEVNAIKNPINNKALEGNVQVKYESNQYTYTFTPTTVCDID